VEALAGIAIGILFTAAGLFWAGPASYVVPGSMDRQTKELVLRIGWTLLGLTFVLVGTYGLVSDS